MTSDTYDRHPQRSVIAANATELRDIASLDRENQTTTNTSSADPYNLSQKFKSSMEIQTITANTTRKRIAIFNPLAARRNNASKLAEFYNSQNSQIERYLKPVHEHVREARETTKSEQLQYRIALYGSFVCNIFLSGLQLYGAVSSGSLSLFTTMADSIFDPLSNVTLILCNRAAKQVNTQKYPAGKARIETVGNVFFSFIMMAVSLILVAFSCQELAEGGDASFHLPAVVAVAVAFTVKLCLFLYCWALRNKYSQIRILWEDHRNDLFINGFGILTSVGGSKIEWWIDPMGAIILSLLILSLWLHTAIGEFKLLLGVTAQPDILNMITYVAMTHSEDSIKGIDTVRAYHSGPRLIIEVDVVMDRNERISVCHDVAEELQGKLESLPNVERAFVHIDYETMHKPEHLVKKDM
jgi:cation diffusion facilitator family transporter